MMCPWCGVWQYFDMMAHQAVCFQRPGVVVIPPADKRPRKKLSYQELWEARAHEQGTRWSYRLLKWCIWLLLGIIFVAELVGIAILGIWLRGR